MGRATGIKNGRLEREEKGEMDEGGMEGGRDRKDMEGGMERKREREMCPYCINGKMSAFTKRDFYNLFLCALGALIYPNSKLS